MIDYSYLGDELQLFAKAVNWKLYYCSLIEKFMQGPDVLEVGAGVGTNTLYLINNELSWVCLEPDPKLAKEIAHTLTQHAKARTVSVRVGTLDTLPPQLKFNSILYIDVLEHIKDDSHELERSSEHLEPNGVVIIIAPAHNYLFSEFDSRIGHFRRYNKASLKSIVPEGLSVISMEYLDSVGFFASLANKLFLKQGLPTLKQIKSWDSIMIPVSKKIDRALCCQFGKSIFAVLGKEK